MAFALTAIVAFVALEHLGFLVLEMFFWRRPIGLRIFRQDQKAADSSAVLAMNQGLYNGFLAAGLAWSLFVTEPRLAGALQMFFLSCVAVAGIFGAATVTRRVFFVQALPAIAGLVLLWKTAAP